MANASLVPFNGEPYHLPTFTDLLLCGWLDYGLLWLILQLKYVLLGLPFVACGDCTQAHDTQLPDLNITSFMVRK